MDHPDLVQAQRSVASDYVTRHYAWDEVVDRLEAIYAALVERRPLPTPEPAIDGAQ
jgi:hypothetical protein